MITTEELRPRVRKGIAAIEEYERGATDRIDLDTLDLYSQTRCALAQSIGNRDFVTGRNRLNIPPGDNHTAPYGFSLSYAETPDYDNPGDSEEYANLREAWVIELTEHRTAKAALVAD